MKYRAKIESVQKNPEKLLKAFSPELKNPKVDRSDFIIKKTKNSVVFEIDAMDGVALRATSDSIIKLLIVYEKTGNIK